MSEAAMRPAPGGGLHPLAGFTSADASARLIRNYRYAVERTMRMLGGWIALTPELSAKLLLGRHVWDNAQHADLLGKRLPELRAHAHVSEPANPEFAAFMDAVESPAEPHQTIERLVGVYRVVKPHLLATYEDHLRQVNEVYEPPTQRILARLVDDERRHVAAGGTVIAHLIDGPAREHRARRRQVDLEMLLAAAGGVTGTGLPAPARTDAAAPDAMLSDDARQFIRLEQSLTHWPMPEGLARALGTVGEALVAGDASALRPWLPADLGADVAGAGLDRLDLRSHRIAAFAKVGHKRLVKIRLEGRVGAATVGMRWALTAEGWRAEALDPIAVDRTAPA